VGSVCTACASGGGWIPSYRSQSRACGQRFLPAYRIWRCRCGPKECPVFPVSPSSVPGGTVSPAAMSRFEPWQ